MEYIAARNEDWWVCLCGNEPNQAGFFPCNGAGEPVEPTPAEWTSDCYVCDRCGRIIRQADRCVVGVRFNHALSSEECSRICKAANQWRRGPRSATPAEKALLVDWVCAHEGPAPKAVVADYVNQYASIAVFEQPSTGRSRYHGWVMSVVWENGPKHSDLFIQQRGKLIGVASLPIYTADW
jgi:hypothetical protein